jgi:hypothetical protein
MHNRDRHYAAAGKPDRGPKVPFRRRRWLEMAGPSGGRRSRTLKIVAILVAVVAVIVVAVLLFGGGGSGGGGGLY